MVDFTEEQLAEFKDAFDKFDENNDGTIDITELGTVLKNLGFQMGDDEVQAMLKEVDTDQNGTIEFNEFTALIKKKVEADAGNALPNLFEAMRVAGGEDGAEKDGISAAKLREFLKTAMGDTVSDVEVDGMIREADKENKGYVSLANLKAVVGV